MNLGVNEPEKGIVKIVDAFDVIGSVVVACRPGDKRNNVLSPLGKFGKL